MVVSSERKTIPYKCICVENSKPDDTWWQQQWLVVQTTQNSISVHGTEWNSVSSAQSIYNFVQRMLFDLVGVVNENRQRCRIVHFVLSLNSSTYVCILCELISNIKSKHALVVFRSRIMHDTHSQKKNSSLQVWIVSSEFFKWEEVILGTPELFEQTKFLVLIKT